MLLSYNSLAVLVAERVIYHPGENHERLCLDDAQINSSSIDLTLGDFVEMEVCPQLDNCIIQLGQRDPLTTQRIDIRRHGYTLRPGEFILAQTREMFDLPLDLSAEYKLKSSMARVGLEHLTAGWADSGWHSSVLTLELKNMTRYHAIHIMPGDFIGQMVFFRHDAVPQERSYAARGRYNNDPHVTKIKL